MAEAYLTRDDVQAILKDLLPGLMEATVRAVKAPNPVEERQMKEQLENDKRRMQAMLYFSRAQAEADWTKKHGCTHSRYANGHRQAGHPCPKGQGEWVTQAQVHGHGIASVICLRCSTIWLWKATADELQAILDGNLAGAAPPLEERCLSECCLYCHKMFSKAEFAEHDQETCQRRMEEIDRQRAARMAG